MQVLLKNSTLYRVVLLDIIFSYWATTIGEVARVHDLKYELSFVIEKKLPGEFRGWIGNEPQV